MNKIKFKHFEQFQDHKAKIYPELHSIEGYESDRILSRSVTFQVTDDCNLKCTYCYQINKGKRKMSLETAKKFVDFLLSTDESNHYINPTISPFIILEFIGGEPFLEIELIDKQDILYPYVLMVLCILNQRFKNLLINIEIILVFLLQLMVIKNYMINVEFFQMGVHLMIQLLPPQKIGFLKADIWVVKLQLLQKMLFI